MTAFLPPEPNAALVVGPDDYLVVSYPAGLNQTQFEEIRAVMVERHPDLYDRVIFFAGDQQIAAVRDARPPIAPQPPAALASPSPPG